MFALVTVPAEVARLQKRFRAAFIKRAVRLRRVVTGMNLTTDPLTIYWDEAASLWGHFGRGDNRTWNPFGIDDPTGQVRVKNCVQINASLKRSLAPAGAFLYDAESQVVFIGHSGRLRGVSSADVLPHFETIRARVNKTERDFIVVSELDDPALNHNIARFARVCEALKVARSEKGSAESRSALAGDEYAGDIEYRRSGYVVTRRTHGLVQKCLRERLEAIGAKDIYRDVNRDLAGTVRDCKFLFEIKTTATTTSIYTAVGQLMMLGRASSDVICVLVSPPLDAGDRKRLARLEISHVAYKQTNAAVEFIGLKRALGLSSSASFRLRSSNRGAGSPG